MNNKKDKNKLVIEQWFKNILSHDHAPTCAAVSFNLRLLVSSAEYYKLRKY